MQVKLVGHMLQREIILRYSSLTQVIEDLTIHSKYLFMHAYFLFIVEG